MDVVGAAEVVVHHERTVRVVREVWEEKEKDEELEVTLDEDECGGPCVDPVGSLSGVGADPATPHWRQRKRRRHIVARPVDARSGYAQRGRGRRLRVTGGTGGGWRGRTAGKSGVACVQGRNALDRSLGADRSGADDGTADAEVPDTGTALFDGLGLTESTATPSDRTPPELPRCQGHSVPCRRVLSRRRSASGSAAYYVCARRPRCATFWWEREWLAQQTWRQQCTDATDTATDDATTAATSQAAPALFDLSYHHRLQDALQRLTGFSAFRTVQREAIEHLLRAESVIAVLPTAHGKSLLYQLAAALLPGTAVVITPLVSLMADQLKHMPAALSCACVHAQGMTAAEIRATYDALQRGAYKVLLVTPERFVSDAMVRVLQQTHVSLLVLDEAHCVAEWALHFRPAYLRIPAALHALQRTRPCAVLALTATATPHVIRCIQRTLHPTRHHLLHADVRPTDGRLTFSVSRPPDRHQALVQLLRHRPEWSGPVVVYVQRRRDADQLAAWLQNHLVSAGSYHAGLPLEQRHRVQQQFMQNRLRVVVATVAFGMGLHKADVRGVVHWSVPPSIEAYVQETGRAGRDGRPAQCHLFYGAADAQRTESWVGAAAVDESAVRRLLRVLGERGGGDAGDGVELERLALFEVAALEVALDMPAALIETLLVRLAEAPISSHADDDDDDDDGAPPVPRAEPLLQLLPPAPSSIRFAMYRGRSQLDAATQRRLQALVAVATTAAGSSAATAGLQWHTVATADACRAWRMLPAQVLTALEAYRRQGALLLEWIGASLAVRVSAMTLADAELDAWLAWLLHPIRRADAWKATRARCMRVLAERALQALEQEQEQESMPQRRGRADHAVMAAGLEAYFRTGTLPDLPAVEADLDAVSSAEATLLIADVGALLATANGAKTATADGRQRVRTAAQAARILHGISSARFPYHIWHRSPFWGRYAHLPYAQVLHAAERALARRRQRRPPAPHPCQARGTASPATS
ncbi:hypothetical protein CDCA_CDCA18G4585 [Cyanidium caldarium]|uniref:DNA 3'-5' helicase n=1 Tax=Cyanidium caldarium TaxID=2771 RepID=A0AAV9J2L4_CYACA|nr:hypothetical protein CDCA_CDCA18G4585 [Cyanidium caldarium]